MTTFGCACYPNLSATASHKLAPRSTRSVFLGYSPDHKGYRYLDLTSRRIIISRHIVFDESDFPFSTSSTPTTDHELDSMFPTDPVVQQLLSACPCPAGFPGAPAPLSNGLCSATRGTGVPRCALRGSGVTRCATRGPGVTSCTSRAVRPARAGLPAPCGAGPCAGSRTFDSVPGGSHAVRGSCARLRAPSNRAVPTDSSTGAVAPCSGSLSRRASGVPPARPPSGSWTYSSHGDAAGGWRSLVRDPLCHCGRPVHLSGTLLRP